MWPNALFQLPLVISYPKGGENIRLCGWSCMLYSLEIQEAHEQIKAEEDYIRDLV